MGTKIIAPNFWGWIADRSQKNLRIIRWTSFVAALLFAGFLTAQNYMEFAWLTIAFSFFWNAPLPLYEATTLAHLQADSHSYSRIRLWGSVGFILTVVGVGKLIDSQPIVLLPVLITGLLLLTWLTAAVTPESRANKHDESPVMIASILKKPEVLAFMLVYVLIQIAHAPYYVFYTIYLQQHLYSTVTTGLLWSLGVIAEIILFLFYERLIEALFLAGYFVEQLGLLRCCVGC